MAIDPKQLKPTERRTYLIGMIAHIKDATKEVVDGLKDTIPSRDQVDLLRSLVEEFADIHETIDQDLFAEQRGSRPPRPQVVEG